MKFVLFLVIFCVVAQCQAGNKTADNKKADNKTATNGSKESADRKCKGSHENTWWHKIGQHNHGWKGRWEGGKAQNDNRKCGKNEQVGCGKTVQCQPQCLDQGKQPRCSSACTSDCLCKDGYIRNNGQCITNKQCEALRCKPRSVHEVIRQSRKGRRSGSC